MPEKQDRLKELWKAANVGADLSPGDSLCLWAYNEIIRLKAIAKESK